MKKTTYKTPKERWLGWYIALCIAGGVFVLGFGSLEGETPRGMIAVLVFIFAFLAIMPVIAFRGTLTIDDHGIKQRSGLNNWILRWSDIADWSTLEVYDSDGSGWEPAVILKSHGDTIKAVNREFLTLERVQGIKDILTDRIGSSKDYANPSAPHNRRDSGIRWV